MAKASNLDSHITCCKTCDQNNLTCDCMWVWQVFCHIKRGI